MITLSCVIGDVGELLGEQSDVERSAAPMRDGEVGLRGAGCSTGTCRPDRRGDAEFGEGGGELIGPVGDLGERCLGDVVGAVAGVLASACTRRPCCVAP